MKVLWSPRIDNRFLLYTSNAIHLYQTEQRGNNDAPKGSISLSDETYANQISSLSDVQLMKCVSWYPGDLEDSLIAVGQANGKVFLSNFGINANSDLSGREFIPKHRQCNYLTWNPVHHNLLAEGLDKHRSDSCIVIWDVASRSSNEFSMPQERQRYSSSDNAGTTKPCIELGNGETSSSFAWFHDEPKTFITGINQKMLRVYDLRDVSKPHLVSYTKAVYGLCTDPQSGSRVASFSENQVSVWDVRSFDKPILTLPEPRQVLKIEWCPTRMGFLAVLWKDSTVVKLYDIKHSVIGTEELDPVIIERNIQPNKSYAVSHFHWHPKHENRLLTVSPSGSVRDNQIFEKMSMSLSPDFHLTWACGKRLLSYDCASELSDIAVRMKSRAIKGYGANIDQPWSNAEIVEDEPHLHALWHWLDLCKVLSKADKLSSKQPAPRVSRLVGVQGLLGLNEFDKQSDTSYNSWIYPDGAKSNSQEKSLMYQYRSVQRTQALQMCGWWTERSNNKDQLLSLVDSLVEENREYERAAAIALFNLKIGKAIEILSTTPLDNNDILSVVAMALSGFTEERNALWKKTCSTLRRSLDNPYLRAMFAFLGSDRDSYDEVLKDDPCMAVKDRVAFACIYLPDNKLFVYLRDLCKHLKDYGNLDGILLTGMTTQGVDLLEKHVDLTGDVQTAALTAVYSFPNDISQDKRVINWIESYRSLLDCWRLWHQRAKFDIILNSLDNNPTKVPGSAFASCNYCGKSIACNMNMATRSRPHMRAMMSTHKPITCCSSCRKPLPRCSLCLTNLGTPSGTSFNHQKDTTDQDKLSEFSNWFTWCQLCRHGGHASHITQWFSGHKECPVTGCSCKCMSLDPISHLEAVSSLQPAVS